MPESGDIERLIILLEAKTSELEKNMAKASGVTAKAYREMSLGSKRATTQMENDAIRSSLRINQALASVQGRVGAFSKAFLAGAVAPVAGLVTLTAAINGTEAALKKFGDIADQSAAAGLDPEFFQGLAYQAKMAGIETDALAGALGTFAKNAGLAAEGKGKMVSTLEALNPQLLTSIQHATTQEQRFKLVADAIAQAKDQATAAAIASAAFGDQGVRIAAAFKDGSAAIDETMAKAKQLGLIIDRDVIARADELGDEWDTIAQVLDNRVKTALVDLGPLMVDLVGWAADMGTNLAIVADQLREIENRRFINPLQNSLAAIENERAPIMMEIERLKDELAKVDPGSAWAAKLTFDIEQKAARAEQLMQQALQYQERIAQLQGKPAGAPTPTKTAPSATSPDNLGVAPTDFNFRSWLDGLDKGGKKTASSLRDVHTTIVDNADAVTELSQRWKTAEDMAQSFASSILTGMRSGKSAIESVIDAFGSLGDQLISMATNQAISALFGAISGGLTGGLGSIAGGAAIPMGGFVPGLTGPRLFADGTANTGGRRGEPIGIAHGQEAVIPLPNGGKVPVQMPSGGDTGVHVTVGLSVDSELVIRPYVEKITQRHINEFDRTIPAKVHRGILAYEKNPSRGY